MNRLHLCPVCGALLKQQAWKENTHSYDICPCCRIEFGHTDTISLIGKDSDGVEDMGFDEGSRKRYCNEWRACWITRGMPWWASWEKPADYDPVKQLARIGIVVPESEDKFWWMTPNSPPTPDFRNG